MSQLTDNDPLMVAAMALDSATCADPFAVLGPHHGAVGLELRVFAPRATAVTVTAPAGAVEWPHEGALTKSHEINLTKIHPTGLWSGPLSATAYRLRLSEGEHTWVADDPYRFGFCLGELDCHLLAEGTHLRPYEKLGAHPAVMDGVPGTIFAVWAPNAHNVSVVGSFNQWDGRIHPMRLRADCGVWEIFLPAVAAGDLYKFEIHTRDGHVLPLKNDPYAFQAEVRPATASVVHGLTAYAWTDQAWLKNRAHNGGGLESPMSIYEVHLGSWQRAEDGGFLNYRALAHRLVPYVKQLGFTHLELLPVHEHPFDGSWGYQPIGLFAPTSRHGSPEDFKAFVDACHSHDLGVIIDWVPGHFPSDTHGLAQFDGTHLYEHADPRQGLHSDWGTLIYNVGRAEVRNFLIANALFWIEQCHIDGLRVDAVASMLYLDYSRKDGEWVPNAHGGRENLESVAFLRRLNEVVYGEGKGAVTIAEESTAWPMVSRPTYVGGLGFGYKWNMGWMHDTLRYFKQDPLYRRYHHDHLTFGVLYAFSENFVLAISHDEVVHGKGSLINKMPGDRWQRFANLRAYFAFMWAHPGKKLLFMGCEFGQDREWNEAISLDWHELDNPYNRGAHDVIRDANRLYAEIPALWQRDFIHAGFEWIDCHDADNSVYAWLRWPADDSPPLLAICNLTPEVRQHYVFGVPKSGLWREVLNTDWLAYGGSGVSSGPLVATQPDPYHGRANRLVLTLPPLATVWYKAQG